VITRGASLGAPQPEIAVAFAQLSKVRLEYEPYGHGAEKILFIHGFQASARIWQLVQEALPQERYSSLAVNNRGAGASDAPADENDFTVQAFAADAFELATKLGWSDFTLVGHSMGGATAAQLAVDHPGLLKALVLLDPAGPDGRDVPGGDAGLDGMIDQFIAARRGQLARGVAGDAIDASRAAVPAELMRLLGEDMRAAPERRLRGSLRSMLTLRIGGRLKGLPMPVLLAAGDQDELIPIDQLLATWAKCPSGTGLQVWHGVGHSPNLECPDQVAALLRTFIEEAVPARKSRPAG
jgi:3-oxoadipate enol-lactonase